jgi:hypothetical protein
MFHAYLAVTKLAGALYPACAIHKQLEGRLKTDAERSACVFETIEATSRLRLGLHLQNIRRRVGWNCY